MNFRNRIGLIVCLAVAAPILSAQDADVGEQSDSATHMQEHLVRITMIKSEIIGGDLDGTKRPANWLANHEPLPEASLLYVPFTLSMQEHAREIVVAEDIVSAAASVSAIATDCANCHMASEVNLQFGFDQEPSEWQDLETHMQRHQWAVDRLWEGLIAPSDASWSRGIRMLAEAPLEGTETSWDEAPPERVELAQQVHLLGREAVSAITPEARASVYSKMLGTCAACHARTGGGPG